MRKTSLGESERAGCERADWMPSGASGVTATAATTVWPHLEHFTFRPTRRLEAFSGLPQAEHSNEKAIETPRGDRGTA
jgi:hypothetical protein